MDKIFIQELEFFALIGAYAEERSKKQKIILDLELGVDAKNASLHDSLTKTVDYDRLVEQVKTYISNTEFFLIETLAEHIAQFILKEFDVHWLRLYLTKPNAITNTKKVGIIIERSPA